MDYSIDLLLEGRKEDAREKFEHIPQELFDILVDGDPSGNQKYLMWMLTTLEKVGTSEMPRYYENLVEDVTFFHNNIQTFSVKDINRYPSWEFFTEAVGSKRSELHTKEKVKRAKKDSKRIYEDGNLLILVPKSFESSCVYGAGTRWCTTTKDNDKYFRQYTRSGLLIYVIRKGIPETDDLHKLAIYIPDDIHANIQIFNAPDNGVSMTYVKEQLGEGEWDTIRQPVMDYLSDINNPRVEQFMTEEEIISYLESGDVDILKFSEKKLMEIFKTFEKIIEFVESKGLNPLYELPPLFVIKGMGVNTKDYMEHYNVNLFDYVAYVVERMEGTYIVKNLVGLFKNWWEDYDFDEVFNELQNSKFKDFETFFNFMGENISEEHWARLGEGGDKVFYLFLFNGDTSLMYDYFNSYNKDASEFISPLHLYKLLGDGTVNYIKDFDKLLSFSTELINNRDIPLDTLIEMGYSSEDVKYLIDESVITHHHINLEMLRYIFHGDGEAGLTYFFSIRRMDTFLADMFHYELDFDDILTIYGNNTFEFIEGELEKLGESVDMEGFTHGDYDFTDESDLTKFIGEQIEDLEMYTYYNETNDVNGYLEKLDRYGKELTQLMEVKLLRDSGGSSDKGTYNRLKSSVIGQIDDLEMRGEDLYLISTSWCDFKPWISEYNEYLFENYMCIDDHFEISDDTIYDWTDQVWDNINTENMVRVKNYLLEYIGKEIEYTDSNDEEQTVTLTKKFIIEVSDSELGVIVKGSDDLDTLKQDLSSAYHWGYNNAYESEFGDAIMGDIYDYTGSSAEDTKWEEKTITIRGEEKTVNRLVSKCDFELIIDNLNTLADSYLNYDESSDEFQYGDYVDLVGELITEFGELETISVNMPDYPHDPEKHFNELIGDYI
jgi:hypothetical protein